MEENFFSPRAGEKKRVSCRGNFSSDRCAYANFAEERGEKRSRCSRSNFPQPFEYFRRAYYREGDASSGFAKLRRSVESWRGVN